MPTSSSSSATRAARSERGRRFVSRKPKPTFARDGEVREQRAFLGHVAHSTPFGGKSLTAVVEHAIADLYDTRPRGFEARDHAQERGLAASRFAEHAGERTALDVQCRVDEHGDRSVAGREMRDLDGAHNNGEGVERSREPRAMRASTTTGRIETAIMIAAYGAAAPYARLVV